MSFLTRFLLALVFLLCLFVGGALLVHIDVLSSFEPVKTMMNREEDEPLFMRPKSSGWSLSRLPLLPWKPSERELVAVMIENHELARPFHQGLEEAVMIQEIFVEGFITRFAALFDVRDLPERIGPVRSLRPYFISSALPWTKRFVHIGGSPEALERVEDRSDVHNFDGVYLEEFYFYRQQGVPAPHDLFVTAKSFTDMLADADEKYAQVVQVPLYDVGRAPHGSGATVISVHYYNPLHNVEYEYDGSYQRTNGRIISPATPSNLVFLQMPVEEVGPFGRLAIETVGSGNALYFRSGKVYFGTWKRASETEPYQLLDTTGENMVFSSGQIWLTVVESLERIDWE